MLGQVRRRDVVSEVVEGRYYGPIDEIGPGKRLRGIEGGIEGDGDGRNQEASQGHGCKG